MVLSTRQAKQEATITSYNESSTSVLVLVDASILGPTTTTCYNKQQRKEQSNLTLKDKENISARSIVVKISKRLFATSDVFAITVSLGAKNAHSRLE